MLNGEPALSDVDQKIRREIGEALLQYSQTVRQAVYDVDPGIHTS